MKTVMTFSRLIFIICLFAIGCGGGGTHGSGVIDVKVRVQGEIKDSGGAPVADAKIKVVGDEKEYLSDSTGRFDFESDRAIGTFVIEVKKGDAESRLEVASGPSVQTSVGLVLTLNASNEFEINRINRGQELLPGKECSKDTECGTTEYCNFVDLNCGNSGTKGLCQQVPVVCTADYNPVCGCDGNKYSNSCSAGIVAVSVSVSKGCLSPNDNAIDPPSSECLTNAECKDGFYCFTENVSGNTIGRCLAIQPGSSNCLAYVDPVCGSNGVTYSNECEARVAGQTVAKPGSC